MSIKDNFHLVQKRNPHLSSFVCFAMAIEGKKISRRTISENFNKLVEKEDYLNRNKEAMLRHMCTLSNGSL